MRYFKKSDDGCFEYYRFGSLVYRCKILAFVFDCSGIIQYGDLDYINNYTERYNFNKSELNIVYSDDWDIELINDYFFSLTYNCYIYCWYKNNFL